MKREKRKRWVRGGRFVVEVEVDVVYPEAFDGEACLEPATSRRLAEIAQRAEDGDLAFLKQVGTVFEAVPQS
jgi:hypothetical protein